MKSLNKKKIFTVLLFFIYMIVQFVVTSWINTFAYNGWIVSINILILFDIIIKLFIVKQLRIKVLSLTVLIVFLSYLFQFGHLILLMFDYDFRFMTPGINIYPLAIYKEAIQFALIGITSLFFGSIVVHRPKWKTNNIQHKFKEAFKDRNLVKFIGFTLLIISLPINIYILANRFLILLRYGKYNAIFDYDVNYMVELFGDLMFIGIFLILVYYKDKPKISKRIFVITLGYIALSMFTGFRGKAMALIVANVYLYNLAIERFSTKKIVKIIFLGIGALFLLMIIRNTRKYGLDIQMILDIIRSSNNLFAETLEEFGYTINVTCEIISQISVGKANHEHLKFFLSEFASVIPFASRIFPNQEFGAMIVRKLGVWNMGTSYIADTYYYFGYLGWLILFFMGVYIRKVENLLELFVYKKNYLMVASFVLWVISILTMVRSTLVLGLRYLAWSYILIKVLNYIYAFLPKRASNELPLKK